jgi:hypothetical protein
MWTIIILIAAGIFIIFMGAGLVVGLFKVCIKIFENLFGRLLKSVWGIIGLVVFFYLLFKLFPHGYTIK